MGGERNEKVHDVSSGATGSIVKGQVTVKVSGNSGNQRRGFEEKQGCYGWGPGRQKGEGSGTAGVLCRSLVLSGCGRNESPRGCVGESDRMQMGVPGAGGVRGAVRHTSQEADKEAAYGGELGLESQAWVV